MLLSGGEAQSPESTESIFLSLKGNVQNPAELSYFSR